MSNSQLAEFAARLAGATGKAYWQRLEELADTEEFKAILRDQFPRQASVAGSLSRRQFFKLMAASLALAGLTACANEAEKIVPYVKQPQDVVPGNPLFFASTLTLAGYATGVLVESHEGRPTKIEGNPDHPASLGKTDAFMQASLLTLYDPDRSQAIKNRDHSASWNDFGTALATALSRNGGGLRILTETVTSPTLANQLQAILTQYPGAKWHQYEPMNRDNAYEGARLAFGTPLEAIYHFDQADVILSLDSDFLRLPGCGVRYAHDFMDQRRVRGDQKTMNRLYAVESTPTITGATADHRMMLQASQIEGFARALAQQLGLNVKGNSQAQATRFLTALMRDLQQHAGSSLVIAGDQQPPIVHALAYAINDALGNTGKTVSYTDPVIAGVTSQLDSLRGLVADMQAGDVEIMVIIGGNPIYNTPIDLNFASALGKVGFTAHLSLYEDETSAACQWHIPETHPLEAWSDARAYDGTISIIQPLISPLYGGKSAHEVLVAITGHPDQQSHDIVRANWQTLDDAAWKKALHDGLIANTALAPKAVTLNPNFDQPSAAPASNGLEIIFQPDPTIYDGRFANNGWLQELPKPLLLLTWDNVALISQSTADGQQLKNGDVIELAYRNRTIQTPIWIMPGQPDNSITVFLGYGRTQAGHIGTGIGYNAYALRTSDAPWFDSGLSIHKTGQTMQIATVHDHYNMEGRDLIRATTLQNFTAHPDFAHEKPSNTAENAGSLYPAHDYTGQQWGMAIDLSVCIGCNACVLACQAENNIPIVGKDEVLRGHEMHWLRVDRYQTGDDQNPQTDFQPVPCMQCENAPCEVVCPVEATAHSSDGLNDMTYNRCVGTRYCSNNCPYKVRRFNFFKYADYDTPVTKLLYNPEVTVRERGVMEKCTYCVQRIRKTESQAGREGRDIRDGEVQTACQQACPTKAITFGDISDPNSAVAKLKAQPHNYELLGELNTRPRTTYLGRVRNPNPELEA